MANSTDNLDASGLMPGSAPWDLTPDQGVRADNCTPRYGADIRCTTAYPSQEPQSAAPYDPDLQAIANSFNAGAKPAHGADMRNYTRAQSSGPAVADYSALPEKV